MDSLGSQSSLGDAAGSSSTSTAAVSHHGIGLGVRRATWSIVLACGAAGGLVSWLAGELAFGAFRPQLFLIQNMGISSLQPSRESQRAADIKNAALAFAILGGVTGLSMGIGRRSRRSRPSAVLKVGLLAVGAGALVGAVASLGLVPLFFRERSSRYERLAHTDFDPWWNLDGDRRRRRNRIRHRHREVEKAVSGCRCGRLFRRRPGHDFLPSTGCCRLS